MTKICILGASGLIGHRLFMSLQNRFKSVYAVLHGNRDRFKAYEIFEGNNVTENVDVADFDSVTTVLEQLNPDVVLNCAGITKRRDEINDPLAAIGVNSFFPHRLAAWSKQRGIRVIHFSTDCVFDGTEGSYTESSHTTGRDAYGQTKALGELKYDHSLTIRSSFIGQELSVHSELLDWFLQQNGKSINGFTKAMYSGVSTLEMARVVGDIIEHHPKLAGLFQLAIPEPISKFELLCLARDAYGLDVEVLAEDKFVLDASLDGAALRNELNIQLPDWPTMMKELAQDNEFYLRGKI